MKWNIYICQYCGKICKNDNSLHQHEIRCKMNPDRIICYGNKHHMPEHTSLYYKKLIKMSNGDTIDVTQSFIDEYRQKQLTCEICGRTLEESVKWDSQNAPKKFCIDHDHNTKKFRGLLCSCCNRQLGWYEKYKNIIEYYLNKNK